MFHQFGNYGQNFPFGANLQPWAEEEVEESSEGDVEENAPPKQPDHAMSNVEDEVTEPQPGLGLL